jgi:hypothetical protein
MSNNDNGDHDLDPKFGNNNKIASNDEYCDPKFVNSSIDENVQF